MSKKFCLVLALVVGASAFGQGQARATSAYDSYAYSYLSYGYDYATYDYDTYSGNGSRLRRLYLQLLRPVLRRDRVSVRRPGVLV